MRRDWHADHNPKRVYQRRYIESGELREVKRLTVDRQLSPSPTAAAAPSPLTHSWLQLTENRRRLLPHEVENQFFALVAAAPP